MWNLLVRFWQEWIAGRTIQDGWGRDNYWSPKHLREERAKHEKLVRKDG